MAPGAIEFVMKMGWTKVVFLFSRDAFGHGLHTACQQYKDKHAPGLGWLSVPMPDDTTKVEEIKTALLAIKSSDTLIVFCAVLSGLLPVVLTEAAKIGVIGKASGYNWIGFNNWGPQSDFKLELEE